MRVYRSTIVFHTSLLLIHGTDRGKIALLVGGKSLEKRIGIGAL